MFIKNGEYGKKIEELRRAYFRGTIDAAVAVFPVGTVLIPPSSNQRLIVTGHKQSYDGGVVSVWVKKLDRLGRPNGKVFEKDPASLDYCLRVEKENKISTEEELEKKKYPDKDLYGHTRTPWAVICRGDIGYIGYGPFGVVGENPGCGFMYLSEKQYKAQMNCPNLTWRCLICGQEAAWDDENHEDWYELKRREKTQDDESDALGPLCGGDS